MPMGMGMNPMMGGMNPMMGMGMNPMMMSRNQFPIDYSENFNEIKLTLIIY
jgi:hypothetical protein